MNTGFDPNAIEKYINDAENLKRQNQGLPTVAYKAPIKDEVPTTDKPLKPTEAPWHAKFCPAKFKTFGDFNWV